MRKKTTEFQCFVILVPTFGAPAIVSVIFGDGAAEGAKKKADEMLGECRVVEGVITIQNDDIRATAKPRVKRAKKAKPEEPAP